MGASNILHLRTSGLRGSCLTTAVDVPTFKPKGHMKILWRQSNVDQKCLECRNIKREKCRFDFIDLAHVIWRRGAINETYAFRRPLHHAEFA